MTAEMTIYDTLKNGENAHSAINISHAVKFNEIDFGEEASNLVLFLKSVCSKELFNEIKEKIGKEGYK